MIYVILVICIIIAIFLYKLIILSLQGIYNPIASKENLEKIEGIKQGRLFLHFYKHPTVELSIRWVVELLVGHMQNWQTTLWELFSARDSGKNICPYPLSKNIISASMSAWACIRNTNILIKEIKKREEIIIPYLSQFDTVIDKTYILDLVKDYTDNNVYWYNLEKFKAFVHYALIHLKKNNSCSNLWEIRTELNEKIHTHVTKPDIQNKMDMYLGLSDIIIKSLLKNVSDSNIIKAITEREQLQLLKWVIISSSIWMSNTNYYDRHRRRFIADISS